MNASDQALLEIQQTIYRSSNYTRRNLHQRRLHWVMREIEANSVKTQGVRAIEYGPGSGVYLPVLADHFREVVGADIEEAYLRGLRGLAGQVKRLSLMTDDILQSRIEDEYCDLVLCSEVLEHVRYPERAIKTLFRILKPGGIAVVTTPQKYSVLELCCKAAFIPGVVEIVRRIYGEAVLDPGHISLRTRDQIKCELRAVGFQILKEEQFGLYVPLVAEFLGEPGGRFIEWLEANLVRAGWKAQLWTQAYVLRKPVL